MSFIKTAIAAGAMSMALLSHASAQNLEPWDIREHSAYIVMMDGKMMRMTVGDKGMAMLMKNAKKMPRGTVFIMNGGQLYMINGSKMFDKSGMPSFGAG